MTTKTRNRPPIEITIVGERAFVTGDVYMQRDIVRANSFKWDPERKHWHGHELRAEQLQRELQDQGLVAPIIRTNVLPFQTPEPVAHNMPLVPLQLIQNDGRIYIALDLTPSQLQSMIDKYMHALQTGTGTSN